MLMTRRDVVMMRAIPLSVHVLQCLIKTTQLIDAGKVMPIYICHLLDRVDAGRTLSHATSTTRKIHMYMHVAIRSIYTILGHGYPKFEL